MFQNNQGGGEQQVRQGDWNCQGCNAHNFASRDKCYKCNQWKEGGAKPPQDNYRGGGGGYQDRYQPQQQQQQVGGGGYQQQQQQSHYDQPPVRDERDRGYNNSYDSYRGGDRYDDRRRYDDRDNRDRDRDRYDDRRDYRDRDRRDVRPSIVKRQGDFYCSVCGDLNFATRDSCRKCGKRKDRDLQDYNGEKRELTKKPGDWECSNCNIHNFASRKECFKCHEPNVNNPEQDPNYVDGDWRCFDCSSLNHKGQDKCEKCGRQKTQRRNNDIDCPNCGKLNFSFRATCFECKVDLQNPNANEKEFPPSRKERSIARSKGIEYKSGDWSCPKCNFHNFATRENCKDCGTGKRA